MMDLCDSKTKTLLKSILTDAVVALCKNTLCFEEQIKIDALIGISTDSGRHLMLHIEQSPKRQSCVEATSLDDDHIELEEVNGCVKKKRKNSHSTTVERNSSDSPITIKKEVLSDADDIKFLEGTSITSTATIGTEQPFSNPLNIENTLIANCSDFVQEGYNFSSTSSTNLTLHDSTTVSPLGISQNEHFKSCSLSRNLSCPQCHKQLGNIRSLGRHIKTHFGPMYSCSVCGKQFNRLDNLKRHGENVHKILPESQQNTSQVIG